MLSASATTLRADKAYIDLLEAESTWPTKYVFARPNPVDARRHPIWGLHEQGVPATHVDTYNKLLPTNFRVQVRASHNRPQTELFGTAPYTALGRGLLRYPDTSSAVRQGTWVPTRGSRTAAEVDYNRFDFVHVPRELTEPVNEMRYGVYTRLGPSYMQQPRD